MYLQSAEDWLENSMKIFPHVWLQLLQQCFFLPQWRADTVQVWSILILISDGSSCQLSAAAPLLCLSCHFLNSKLSFWFSLFRVFRSNKFSIKSSSNFTILYVFWFKTKLYVRDSRWNEILYCHYLTTLSAGFLLSNQVENQYP